jgi:hypothetical protein
MLVAAGLAVVVVGVALTWLAVDLKAGPDIGWWIALPLLIAGLGGGLVVSPNQTLTLSQVPRGRAGSAGGALQTAQRIGSSAGIAITGSVFYDALAGDHGDFAQAFRSSLISIGCFCAAALALALADAVTGRRPRRDAQRGDSVTGSPSAGNGPVAKSIGGA